MPTEDYRLNSRLNLQAFALRNQKKLIGLKKNLFYAKPTVADRMLQYVHGWLNIKVCTFHFHSIYSDGLTKQSPFGQLSYKMV